MCLDTISIRLEATKNAFWTLITIAVVIMEKYKRSVSLDVYADILKSDEIVLTEKAVLETIVTALFWKGK